MIPGMFVITLFLFVLPPDNVQSVSMAKIDEETENEKLSTRVSCFDAHIRCHRMSSLFFWSMFFQHVTNYNYVSCEFDRLND